ncbi:Putative phage abortive infection protein [Kosakonia oryzendophytica]|uniref:Putative phage abortive infection protein n=1 Tax=Kosakonia oryzendophytica TaxID=1005665 RepID=A0A1C4ECD2_9ENTR|nr:putative phage abortive infection protein [Kosakonia oryzendophytica]SCC41211.1 Putative phage abortive infection protein [Kosakonia oryzendophytica]
MKINNKFLWLLIFFIFYAVLIILLHKTKIALVSSLGSLGDTFGPVTALCSALAFWGVYQTLQLQKEEIARLEKEMECKEKKEKLASFENTFFHLINNLQNIIADMVFKDTVSNDSKEKGSTHFEHYSGRIVFVKYYEDLLNIIKNDENMKLLDDPKKATLHYKQVCNSFFSARTHLLAHYYRYFVSIVHFVERADISKEAKNDYFYFLKSQLSNYELIMMFYYSFCSQGKQIKMAIESHGLFTDFPVNKLLSKNQVRLLADTSWK